MTKTRALGCVRVVPACLVAIGCGLAASADASFPAVFEVSTLDGTNGFALPGIDAHDNSGAAVSGAGDVNGDGYADFAIGAYLADPGGVNASGETYIVFGGPTVGASGEFSPTTLDGSNGFVLNGISASENSGISVSAAGDINGDTYGDIIIGAPDATPGGSSLAGRVYIVFGGPTVGSAGSIDLASLDGTTGFFVAGIDSHDHLGNAVAGAGDVNGDGFDDVIIGAYAAGGAYIIFGDAAIGASGEFDLSTLNGVNGFKLNGAGGGDKAGWSVAGAGDVNDDDYDDVLIGAPEADQPGALSCGETYIVFGGPTVGGAGSIDLALLNGADGFVITGIHTGDQSGFAVSSAGDINNDGVDDALIGAPFSGPGGEAYIIFGSSTVGSTGSLPLASLNGANGCLINSGFGKQGISVSPAGDINGDAVDDILIGDRHFPQVHGTNPARAWAIFGSDTFGQSGLFAVTSLDGTNGFVINGISDDTPLTDITPNIVAAAGDVNGDGAADILIGARGADIAGTANAGESYIIFGIPAAPACSGDVDGDGDTNSADFVILAANFGDAVPAGTLGDLNEDGFVNAADFAILAGDFGCTD